MLMKKLKRINEFLIIFWLFHFDFSVQSEQHIDTFDEWIDELLWEPSDVSENTEDSYYVQHNEVLFVDTGCNHCRLY